MNLELIDLQNQIVVAIADGIPEEWDAVVVNLEIDGAGDDQRINSLSLYFQKPRRKWFQRASSKWVRKDFRLPTPCLGLFDSLRDATAKSSADPTLWSACTVEFNSEGEYEFSFSYDPPKRINGIHDDESMLKNFDPSK